MSLGDSNFIAQFGTQGGSGGGGSANTIYNANDTIGSGRVATLTDTLTFDGGVVLITRANSTDTFTSFRRGGSLKITDFDGGYIETNWINNSDLPNQRCLIKSHITSKELISTGVNVKIICEKLINNEWYLSDENFTEDEKRLTLKILETAQTLANT